VKVIETELEMRATPERVWSVLTEFGRYPIWNPFIREITGELILDARLSVRIALPGGRPMTFRPKLTRVSPAEELCWLGRLILPGLFDGEHRFRLSAGPDGTVRFSQAERFRGVLVGLLPGSFYARTRRGFEAMNQALKREAEKRG